MQKHPDTEVTVQGTGSGTGAKSLIAGQCNVAAMSRFMKGKEFGAASKNEVAPAAHVIALDAIAVVTNPSNPVRNLTVDQLRSIYEGKTTNWSEVGGPNAPIVLVSRERGSGTYDAFNSLVLHGGELAPNTETADSNAEMRDRVRSTKGAIGYVGLEFLDRTTKTLRINGSLPYGLTVSSGAYPLSRPLFLLTNGYPKVGTPLHAFVTLYLTEAGQQIIEDNGFIPVTKY
jgi:phosphate transport system substrate-binding protein